MGQPPAHRNTGSRTATDAHENIIHHYSGHGQTVVHHKPKENVAGVGVAQCGWMRTLVMWVSSWITSWVLRAIRALNSVGSPIASSKALVCRDCVPPVHAIPPEV